MSNYSEKICIFTPLLKSKIYEAFSTNAETKNKGRHKVASTSVISTLCVDLGSGDLPPFYNLNLFKMLPKKDAGTSYTKNSAKQIKLTRGYYALVDDEDYEYLNQFKWYPAFDNNNIYAIRAPTMVEGCLLIRMHWDVMGGKGIDHVDGNGLNNQKSNLRFCTSAENNHNRRPVKNSSSKYKGVSWDKSAKKWRAQIKINDKSFPLGRYSNEIEAAKAYDREAIKHHGEFARLNFIV